MGMRVRPTNAHTNGELKIRKLMADDQESTADRASYLRRYRYMTTCSSGSTEVRKYESTSEVCTSVRKYGSIYFRTVIVLPEVLYLSVYSCTHNGVPSKIFSYTYAYRVVTALALRTSTIFNFQHILPLELVYCPRTSALERG